MSLLPFEAHPFTISTIENQAIERSETTEKSERGSPEDNSNELQFFINVHGGFTKRLESVARAKRGSNTLKVFVDGPYGSSPDLDVYDINILIAGWWYYVLSMK